MIVYQEREDGECEFSCRALGNALPSSVNEFQFGDACASSNSSPQVMEIEAGSRRFLPPFLLSDLAGTLISSFEVTVTF